jgi:hypothetical protein
MKKLLAAVAVMCGLSAAADSQTHTFHSTTPGFGPDTVEINISGPIQFSLSHDDSFFPPIHESTGNVDLGFSFLVSNLVGSNFHRYDLVVDLFADAAGLHGSIIFVGYQDAITIFADGALGFGTTSSDFSTFGCNSQCTFEGIWTPPGLQQVPEAPYVLALPLIALLIRRHKHG